MTIAYDKAKCMTIDSDTGDYLKVVQSHYSIAETTMALYDKAGKALVVAELVRDGKVVDTPTGHLLKQKWTLIKAFVPTKVYPPTNFEVPEHLIIQLIMFLKAEAETGGTWAAPPQFEFTDARQNMGGAK